MIDQTNWVVPMRCIEAIAFVHQTIVAMDSSNKTYSTLL